MVSGAVHKSTFKEREKFVVTVFYLSCFCCRFNGRVCISVGLLGQTDDQTCQLWTSMEGSCFMSTEIR